MSDLERQLRGLDAADVLPSSPDIATAVEHRLRDLPNRRHAQRTPRLALSLRARPALTLLMTAVVAFGALLATSPGARSAILDLLGLEGARIERGEPSTRHSAPLQLGREVSLTEARRLAGFDVVVPQLAGLGDPSRIGYDESPPPDGRVSLAWTEAPAITGSGMTLVLTELAATTNQVVGKVVPPETGIERVSVDDEPGYWLEGAPHQFSYLTRDGVVRPGTTRLAGDTLLWEHDGLLLRLEGAASKQAALAVARSVR